MKFALLYIASTTLVLTCYKTSAQSIRKPPCDTKKLSGAYDICMSANVREYYKNVNKGYILALNYQMYDSAIVCYRRAFSYLRPFNYDIGFLAWIYHGKRDYKNVVKYYYEAVAEGLLPINRFEMPDYILDNDSIPEYRMVKKQIDSLATHLLYVIDQPFHELTTRLHIVENQIRSLDFFRTDSFLKKDPLLINRFVTHYDNKILSELLAYIEAKGIPHYNQMYNHAEAFWLLVHHQIHSDADSNKKLYQLVKEAIERGNLPNNFMKAGIDYKYMEKGFQYFGSYKEFCKSGKRMLSKPIDTIELVDVRRAQWQFIPLGVEMTLENDTNVVLPQGYKIPTFP